MRASLWMVAVVAIGCTTSFDPSTLRLRDAGEDHSLRDISADLDVDITEAAVDAGDVVDVSDVSDVSDVVAPMDGSSCGAAGQPCCAGAANPCMPGTVCNEGFCAACPGATVACSGVCVDPRTSLSHCGRCGRACSEGQSCVGGECTLVCPTSLHACSGRCVDLAQNPAHCGACGNSCPSGAVCNGGNCIVSCSPGLTVCAGACANTMTDALNCRGCGLACIVTNATPQCVNGACGVASCNQGFGDCDGDPSNGCETPLNTTLHCGRCGLGCAPSRATASCEGGVCRVARCEAGFGDCDGDPANGCETDLLRDAQNCSQCRAVCPSSGGATGVCNMGSCGTTNVVCPTGRAECVGPNTSDCETNVTTASDCGRCGNVCALPNAMNACTAGQCRIMSCNEGFRDCDLVSSNGCEVNVQTTVSSCGRCGAACAPANANGVCAGGQCQIASCAQGFADCDNDVRNGCEVDLRSSVSNCGSCGMRCPINNNSPTCVAGACTVGTCSAGFANCDGNAGNGCEVRVVDDVANCGTCQNACVLPNAIPSCSNGACRVSACHADFADCDRSPSNGCEVDLRSSTAHCGACDQRCSIPNGSGACASRVCAVSACNAGFANCDRDVSNGCETSLNTNSNCGGCGSVCPSATVCTSGSCTSTCAPGQSICGGTCVDTRTSPTNCGGCGRECASRPNSSPTCSASTCGYSCNAGYGDCDGLTSTGCETRLDSRDNCGACGNVCAQGPNSMGFCSAGVCQLNCEPNFRNCDGDAVNGCEVNVATDPGNCGSCLNRCPRPANSLPFCRQGACGSVCNDGWGDCRPSEPGCETNLYSGPYRCGSCIGVCAVGACRGGVCTSCLSNSVTNTVCPSGTISTDLSRCTHDTRADRMNCGACGQACPSAGSRMHHAVYTGQCVASSCGLACEAGWGDCDGNWQNGCEVNTTCDREHCGGCRQDSGLSCVGNTVCCNGSCEQATRPSCNLSAPGCR